MMREHPDHVERWGICEISLDARCPGNPFQDVHFEAEFTHAAASLTVAGFFDGDDVFRVRCMPEHEGTWHWRTRSDHPELDGHEGTFTCTPAGPGNHGPVRVAGDHDFAYADGTWYSAIGTTSYGWIHEAADQVERSLAGILAGPFNKLRMLILPKVYDRWCNDPCDFVFPRADDGWDLERFDPAFFRRLEGHLATLRDHNIEADLILFHPYDRWGFRELPAAVDERYLRYCVARLAAFRNVWWSLANEYELMSHRDLRRWDELGEMVAANDPYGHPRSIHNWKEPYDATRPWITHCSIQHWESLRSVDCHRWRERFGKPVVIDENRYEGDMPFDWGCLTAEEMTHRFWVAAIGGAVNGHSATYLADDPHVYWSRGGRLLGGSPPRIGFLRGILERGPQCGWTPQCAQSACKGDDLVLYYFGPQQPSGWALRLAPGRHRIEIIDTWAMASEPAGEVVADGSGRAGPGSGSRPVPTWPCWRPGSRAAEGRPSWAAAQQEVAEARQEWSEGTWGGWHAGPHASVHSRQT